MRLPSLLSAVALLPAILPAADAPVSYNFEVRPLLSAKCFACHGMDAARRKAELRLDDQESAWKAEAFVPGKPGASLALRRIRSKDPDEIMPPPEKHAALSESEIALLERWVTQGARYEKHWAFSPPEMPAVSTANGEHPIDALIRREAENRGIPLAGPAAPEDWLRRVSFALTGLPPSPEEIASFTADPSPEARARVVDRLLASPAFGERMAVDWLDAARFADTYGRHEDADSTVWPWRDWVIRAFNENLSYDRFITWQIAGDLLPDATQDQVLATAFQRLPVQSNESGSDPEEFRWEQVFDRVRTASTAFMGLTMECARCHDHKYDPFTMRDYYRLAAYLDNIDELGLFARFANGIPAPTAFVYRDGEAEKHEALRKAVTEAEAALERTRHGARVRFNRWLTQHVPPGCGEGLWREYATTAVRPRKESLMREPTAHLSFDLVEPAERRLIPDNDRKVITEAVMGSGPNREGRYGWCAAFPKKISIPNTATVHRWQPFAFSFWLKIPRAPAQGVIIHRSRAGLDAANRGYEITFENGRLTATLGHFYPGNAIRVSLAEDVDFSQWRHVGVSYDGSSRAAGLRLHIDGRRQPATVVRDSLVRDIDYLPDWGDLDNKKVADADYGERVTLTIGARTLDAGMRSGAIDELRFYAWELSEAEFGLLAGRRSQEQEWFDWYLREIDEQGRAAIASVAAARRAEDAFTVPLTEVMVMREMPGPRRATPVLTRGDFRQPGETVGPGVPEMLLPLPSDAPPDRRGLARWLTDPRHPLTSRVAVNRLWSAFFGRGLVPTPEDFGLQGKAPALPGVLDWLAVHFVESGWNVKALCREIALSGTFARASFTSPAASTTDPDNSFLARGPRFRLPAEHLRDAALAAAGLLSRHVGGPSVKPWQPPGLWEDSGTQHVYEPDSGEKAHRRSLYTFWRRTCPPPLMAVFDAPTREFCRVRRETTLTPLQSLAIQNDVGMLEAARVLAEKLVLHHGEAWDPLVADAWVRLASTMPPREARAALVRLATESLAHYESRPVAAATLLALTGESPLAAGLPPARVAAALVMIRALLASDPFLCAF